MKKYALLAFVLVFFVSVANAGVLGLLLKGSGTKAATGTASKGVTRTVTTHEARKAAIGAGLAGGMVGLLAGAGMAASPIPEEQQAVEKELIAAIERGDPVYEARVCMHPEKQEFYTVPQWSNFCPDGSKPKTGKGYEVNLSSAHQ
jgi:hypothetical protein